MPERYFGLMTYAPKTSAKLKPLTTKNYSCATVLKTIASVSPSMM
jgi:hypothetical protein